MTNGPVFYRVIVGRSVSARKADGGESGLVGTEDSGESAGERAPGTRGGEWWGQDSSEFLAVELT